MDTDTDSRTRSTCTTYRILPSISTIRLKLIGNFLAANSESLLGFSAISRRAHFFLFAGYPQTNSTIAIAKYIWRMSVPIVIDCGDSF